MLRNIAIFALATGVEAAGRQLVPRLVGARAALSPPRQGTIIELKDAPGRGSDVSQGIFEAAMGAGDHATSNIRATQSWFQHGVGHGFLRRIATYGIADTAVLEEDVWQCTGDPSHSLKALTRRAMDVDHANANDSLDARMQEAVRAFLSTFWRRVEMERFETKGMTQGVCKRCKEATRRGKIVGAIENDPVLRVITDQAAGKYVVEPKNFWTKAAEKGMAFSKPEEDELRKMTPHQNPSLARFGWWTEAGWQGTHVNELAFREHDCGNIRRVFGLTPFPTTASHVIATLALIAMTVLGFLWVKDE